MNNVFNKAQILKSSEVCDKYSKSVSYETLVGGTATIGRGIKQTQRLSKGIADKPLSAVGTLTSLLCNSAKVKALSFLRLRGASGAQGISATASCREAHKRRFLFNPWILRFVCTSLRMTIPTLALIFTLATTAESWAYESLPNSGSCGDGCLYEVTTDQTTGSRNLRIYNEPGYTGNNSAIQRSFFHAYTYGNDSIFQKIVIDGDFSSIGEFSFWNNLSKSSSCDVEIRGNIGKIEQSAFDIDYLNSLTVLGSIGNFAYDALGSNVNKFQIYCGNQEICADLNSKLSNYKYYAHSTKNYKNLTGQISLISEDKCNQGDYYWDGLSCVKEPDVTKRTCEYAITGYIKVGDYCASPEVTYAKKHYTPAEANQWLKDGNDNFVVLTFKK